MVECCLHVEIPPCRLERPEEAPAAEEAVPTEPLPAVSAAHFGGGATPMTDAMVCNPVCDTATADEDVPTGRPPILNEAPDVTEDEDELQGEAMVSRPFSREMLLRKPLDELATVEDFELEAPGEFRAP